MPALLRLSVGVASAAATLPVGAQTAIADQATEGPVLGEIIVTATKRSEAVREISGSITAFTGSYLQQLGAQDMADYLTGAPGVIFNGSTPGDSAVTIRGISTTTGTDQGQGTTGYFIDEIPLTDPFFAVAVPDIDTFDVDNVSVLRGPQGTLFGSASLGGAINYQTRKPDLTAWDVNLQATGAALSEGSGFDTSGKMMLNAPLINGTLAVRAVFIYREDAGFIDNVGVGVKDSNRTLNKGGRVQVLWSPTEGTSLKYMFLDQITSNRDNNADMPDLVGPYNRSTVVLEQSQFESLIHHLRLDQDLGFATLTASAAYHEKTATGTSDLTPALAPLVTGAIQAISGGAVTFVPSQVTSPAPGSSRGTTFEVRVASAADPHSRFDYLVGVMRDETSMKEYQYVLVPGISPVIDAIFGPGSSSQLTPSDSIVNSYIPAKGTETAAFGEATYHINSQWKATLGGRAFRTEIENQSIASGLYVLLNTGAPTLNQTASPQKQSGFSPKASVTWTPTADLMTYGLVSKGFRYGGPNIIPPQPGVPADFKSDSLWNYELGVRSDFLDHRLDLDGTLFYIDWSDIQLRQQTDAGLNYAVNAGKARSMGVEFSGAWLITRDLKFSTSATYLDAELTQPFNATPFEGGVTAVPAGTPLPGASKWSLANTLTYTWSNVPLQPNFLISHRFVSSATSGTIGQNLEQGNYHLFDFRAAVPIHNFKITAFVSNIANKRGVTTAQELSANLLEDFLVRPRTIGITLDYRL
jgi:outer membrane receptor protein involved in Fe transport